MFADDMVVHVRSASITCAYKYRDIKVSRLMQHLLENRDDPEEVLPLDEVSDAAMEMVVDYGASVACGISPHAFIARLSWEQTCQLLPVTEYLDIPCLGDALVSVLSERILGKAVDQYMFELSKVHTPESVSLQAAAP